MLTPEFAAEGFYVDNNRLDTILHVNATTAAWYPDLGEKAQEVCYDDIESD